MILILLLMVQMYTATYVANSQVEMESEYPRPAACTFKEPMIGYDGVSEHEHISNIPEILCNLQFPDWRYPTPRLDADSHKQRSCTPTTLCNARVVLLG